jgi:hypothetical protein
MRVRALDQSRPTALHIVMRSLAALLVLLLLAPKGEAAVAPAPIVREKAPVQLAFDVDIEDEDGACEESEPQELLECDPQVEATLDEPLVISLLRALDVRLTEAACEELLADIWAQQVCVAGSRECGKMNAAAPPPVPHEWVSSSASGHSCWASLGLPAEAVSRLSFGDGARAFSSRDLQPPVPPPRLSGH